MLPVWNRPMSQGEEEPPARTSVRLPNIAPRLPPDNHQDSHWRPFSCACQFCGEKFGRHSITVHEKHCSKTHYSSPGRYHHIHQEEPVKVATIVTIGLSSGIEKSTIYYRPETRTLSHSTLQAGGYGLPVNGKLKQGNKKHHLCQICGQVVSSDKLSVHSALCQPRRELPTTTVEFPSQPLRVQDPPSPVRKEPPTKVCYICQRKFGSLSIAIHEPQCLKKWQTENRKLPISERKPLPRKRGQEAAIVRALPTPGPTTDPVQKYFENCYTEFEKELVPCKKCRRTFAPERHKNHEENCNAQPLTH